MARVRRARGVTPDGDVQSSPSTVWITTISSALLAVGMAAIAVWNYRDPEMYAETMTNMIAAGFCVLALYMSIAVRVARTRLLADRVERRGVFGLIALKRSDVIGFRVVASALQLCVRPGAGKDLQITQEVLLNPVWIAWLETLTNLDEQDALARQVELEADDRFGHTVAQRRETVVRLSKVSGWITLGAFGIGGWLLFWPRPYELAIIVNVLAPLVALAAVARWRGVFSVAENNSGADISSLWLIPAMAIGLRAIYDVQTLDWKPLMVAAGLLTLPMVALVWVLDRRARSWWMALFSAFVAIWWAWGLASLANALLDKSSPEKVTTIVTERNGEEDDDPTVTLQTLQPPRETFEDVNIPSKLFAAARRGSVICMAVYKGRFGWRWGYVRDCLPWPVPPPVSGKSK